MKTTEIGRIGEDYAVKLLKRSGYRIVDRNIHASHNELDIIAKNKEYIVFVEVKTRTVSLDMQCVFGTPASAVNLEKQHRTIKAARSFLADGKFKKLQPRFDVIEIYLDKDTKKPLKNNHIENAFGY